MVPAIVIPPEPGRYGQILIQPVIKPVVDPDLRQVIQNGAQRGGKSSHRTHVHGEGSHGNPSLHGPQNEPGISRALLQERTATANQSGADIAVILLLQVIVYAGKKRPFPFQKPVSHAIQPDLLPITKVLKQPGIVHPAPLIRADLFCQLRRPFLCTSFRKRPCSGQHQKNQNNPHVQRGNDRRYSRERKHLSHDIQRAVQQIAEAVPVRIQKFFRFFLHIQEIRIFQLFQIRPGKPLMQLAVKFC